MATIIPVGGRVKSASVGLDHLFSAGTEVDETISQMRRDPPDWLRKAFFPRVGKELTQAIRGVGFFRPTLKTDQGMAGNFLPFHIDPSLERSDLGIRSIGYEEGCAIPEAWHPEAGENKDALQAAFHGLDLSATYAILNALGERAAEKGRLPFFLIRPALAERPIVFGRDVIERVQNATDSLVADCITRARKLELAASGSTRPIHLLYVQPDAFVLADGTVAIEKLNCPDVCFFLAGVADPHSRVLPEIRSIVSRMREYVTDAMLAAIGPDITLVTRDEVIGDQQDILELLEIRELKSALERKGAIVSTIAVSHVSALRKGARLLLLNLDYSSASITVLLQRHALGEVTCFPNPYFQMACREVSGLRESSLSPEDKYYDRFLAWTRAQPGSEAGRNDVLRQIGSALERNGIESDVLHAVLETETVPVLRGSLHAWRQFEARTRRPGNLGRIRFREIPALPVKLILTGATGPRLHGFRFMCTA